ILRQQHINDKEVQLSQAPSNKFHCLGGELNKEPPRCDKRDVNAYVDNLVKRKLSHLMDDVYNLKNKVVASSCSKNWQSNANMDSDTVSIKHINYASEELGARIIKVVAVPIGGTSIVKSLLGLEFSANPPVNMLHQSLAPGACFGFTGSRAAVTIQLAKPIKLVTIGLTHVSQERSPRLCINSAPKNFDVYGLVRDSPKLDLLGRWIYANDVNRRTQTYSVNSNCVYRRLLFAFNSNHGANSTCIYR
ncbi:hypothetical protein KR018_000517, partial [Drosophila ironensis]